MFINSSGSVGIGTTSPLALLNVQADNNDANSGQFVVSGATSSLKRLSIGFNTTSNYGFIQPYTALTGYNNLALVPNGGSVGIGTTSPTEILHLKSSNNAAFIRFENTGGDGVYIGGRDNVMEMYTAGQERMRITSGGGVGIGKTASVTGLDVYYADTDGVNSRSGAAAGPSRSLYTGWHSASGTTSGTLSFNVVTNGNVTNTNNSYGSLSDIKLKENIIDTTPKLADLLKVRIVNYNLIGQESKQIGVIAQELETIFPSMIEEYFDKDIYGNDLKTKSKGVKYSVFVPMLIKAVQELKQELDTLKNK
jgi:hypothetical protein